MRFSSPGSVLAPALALLLMPSSSSAFSFNLDTGTTDGKVSIAVIFAIAVALAACYSACVFYCTRLDETQILTRMAAVEAAKARAGNRRESDAAPGGAGAPGRARAIIPRSDETRNTACAQPQQASPRPPLRSLPRGNSMRSTNSFRAAGPPPLYEASPNEVVFSSPPAPQASAPPTAPAYAPRVFVPSQRQYHYPQQQEDPQQAQQMSARRFDTTPSTRNIQALGPVRSPLTASAAAAAAAAQGGSGRGVYTFSPAHMQAQAPLGGQFMYTHPAHLASGGGGVMTARSTASFRQ